MCIGILTVLCKGLGKLPGPVLDIPEGSRISIMYDVKFICLFMGHFMITKTEADFLDL